MTNFTAAGVRQGSSTNSAVYPRSVVQSTVSQGSVVSAVQMKKSALAASSANTEHVVFLPSAVARDYTHNIPQTKLTNQEVLCMYKKTLPGVGGSVVVSSVVEVGVSEEDSSSVVVGLEGSSVIPSVVVGLEGSAVPLVVELGGYSVVSLVVPLVVGLEGLAVAVVAVEGVMGGLPVV